MGTSKPKYTDEMLANLASLPEQELSVGGRIAVGRWRKRLIRENTKVVPVERALEQVEAKPAEVALEPVHALEMARELTWYGESWPEGAVRPRRVCNTLFVDESRALREFAGRIARVRSGLTRRQAVRVRAGIVSGAYRELRPRGAFDARILEEDGTWSVLARYVGVEQ